MLRSKRNYKINLQNHCKEDKQVSNTHKENWDYNITPKQCLQKDQTETPIMLKDTSLINSVEKHKETSLTLKRKHKKAEEDLSVPPKKTIRSKLVMNQVLNECNNTSHAAEMNQKSMLKHVLRRTTRSCSNMFSCNAILKEQESKTHCKSNEVSQQTDLYKCNIKCSQKKSLNIQNSTTQSMSEINVKTLVNSKCKTTCNVSKKIKKENGCGISKSIATIKSKRSAYKKIKEGKIMKLTHHIEIHRKRQQKIHHTVHKSKQHINKTKKNHCLKRTLEKKNVNNFSNVTIAQSNKTNIKMNKNIRKYINYICTKKLVIPLIKIEDLPLAELSKLICTPNSVKNKLKRQKNKKMYYQTKKTTKAECSTYKLLNGTTEFKQMKKINMSYYETFKQNEEINVSYHDSAYEEKCRTLKEIMTKEIDSSITNITFGTNKCKKSLKNEVNDIKTSQNNKDKLETAHLLENILHFFLETKNMTKKNTRQRSRIINSNKIHTYGMKKCIAMCHKCKEVFNLLQQFSDKINFVQDEKLCIECTLCNLQINSLSQFQNHVMNIHLQCERKSGIKKKFEVYIVNLNEKLNLNNDNQIIFECCCCSIKFNSTTDFEKHINKKHYGFNHCIDSIKKCETQQDNTFENNENHISNNMAANIMEYSSQGKEANIPNNKDLNKELIKNCINTKEINFRNNVHYDNSNNESVLLKMEVQEKQINYANQSVITQVTKRTPKIKENVKNINVDERYLNNISKITVTSGSEFSNTSKTEGNNLSFICNICFKKYKTKQFFLSHMSKHIMNPHVEMYNEQETQEIMNNDNMITFETDLIASNVFIKDSQNCVENSKDINILNSNTNLEKTNHNILVPEVINKEDSIEDRNIMEYVIKKDNILMKTDINCDYNLYINLTQKFEEGIIKQKLVTFNINVLKKWTININEQQNIRDKIENKLPMNFITNTNFSWYMSKQNVIYDLKKMYCYICDKRFSSQILLKEHMFSLHNSLFEDTELLNVPMIPWFDNNHKTLNLSVQNADKFKKKYNISSKIKILKKSLLADNKICRKIVYQNFNKRDTDKRSRKWYCNSCKENFALLRNYLRHKYYCHNDESVVHICDNCNKVLTSVTMVNIHICTNVSSWNCKRCNFKFSNGMSLMQHNMNYHLETVGPHTCEICKLNFLTTYMLNKHKAIHSVNNSYNSFNSFTNLSISDYLPDTSNSTNINTELHINKINEQLINDKAISCINKNIKSPNILNELNKNFSKMNITFNVSVNSKETFKCKYCNALYTTELQMKVHLQEWHTVEKCQVCNLTYARNEITKHLIYRHVVLDDLYFEDNVQVTHEKRDFQSDTIRILGLKRLVALYEYQRFDNILENECFNCIICSEKLFSIQSYKIHYLKYHDMMCLLCNIEFQHNFQALEHKTKIHRSLDLYLWVVQKLILSILELSKYGSTIEETILKYSEIRI